MNDQKIAMEELKIAHPVPVWDIDEEKNAVAERREQIHEMLCAGHAAEAETWWLELCARTTVFIEFGGNVTTSLWARVAVEACPAGRGAWFAAATAFDSCLEECLSDVDTYLDDAEEILLSERLFPKNTAEYFGEPGSKHRLRMARRYMHMALDIVPCVAHAMGGKSAAIYKETLSGLETRSLIGGSDGVVQAIEDIRKFCEVVCDDMDAAVDQLEREVNALMQVASGKGEAS